MKDLNIHLVKKSSALIGAKSIFGTIKEFEGDLSPNAVQYVTRILRHLHGKDFIIVPSKKAEAIAHKNGKTFIGRSYNNSYSISKKIKGYTFQREHINNGCQYLSTYLILNYKSFKSSLELLEWLIENSQVVLRLEDEAELIHEHSTVTEIQDLIHIDID
jgi:hypothetical protein